MLVIRNQDLTKGKYVTNVGGWPYYTDYMLTKKYSNAGSRNYVKRIVKIMMRHGLSYEDARRRYRDYYPALELRREKFKKRYELVDPVIKVDETTRMKFFSIRDGIMQDRYKRVGDLFYFCVFDRSEIVVTRSLDPVRMRNAEKINAWRISFYRDLERMHFGAESNDQYEFGLRGGMSWMPSVDQLMKNYEVRKIECDLHNDNCGLEFHTHVPVLPNLRVCEKVDKMEMVINSVRKYLNDNVVVAQNCGNRMVAREMSRVKSRMVHKLIDQHGLVMSRSDSKFVVDGFFKIEYSIKKGVVTCALNIKLNKDSDFVIRRRDRSAYIQYHYIRGELVQNHLTAYADFDSTKSEERYFLINAQVESTNHFTIEGVGVGAIEFSEDIVHGGLLSPFFYRNIEKIWKRDYRNLVNDCSQIFFRGQKLLIFYDSENDYLRVYQQGPIGMKHYLFGADQYAVALAGMSEVSYNVVKPYFFLPMDQFLANRRSRFKRKRINSKGLG